MRIPVWTTRPLTNWTLNLGPGNDFGSRETGEVGRRGPVGLQSLLESFLSVFSTDSKRHGGWSTEKFGLTLKYRSLESRVSDTSTDRTPDSRDFSLGPSTSQKESLCHIESRLDSELVVDTFHVRWFVPSKFLESPSLPRPKIRVLSVSELFTGGRFVKRRLRSQESRHVACQV